MYDVIPLLVSRKVNKEEDMFDRSAEENSLIRQLREGNQKEKIAACAGLIGARSREALSALIEALDDNCPGVQASAAVALASRRSRRAVPKLVTLLLQSADATVRAQVAYSLGEIGDKSAVPHLFSALRNAERRDRPFIIRALGKLGDPSSADGLLAVLQDCQDWETRLDVGMALADLGDARAKTVLIDLVDDPSLPQSERLWVEQTLRQLADGLGQDDP